MVYYGKRAVSMGLYRYIRGLLVIIGEYLLVICKRVGGLLVVAKVSELSPNSDELSTAETTPTITTCTTTICTTDGWIICNLA